MKNLTFENNIKGGTYGGVIIIGNDYSYQDAQRDWYRKQNKFDLFYTDIKEASKQMYASGHEDAGDWLKRVAIGASPDEINTIMDNTNGDLLGELADVASGNLQDDPNGDHLVDDFVQFFSDRFGINVGKFAGIKLDRKHRFRTTQIEKLAKQYQARLEQQTRQLLKNKSRKKQKQTKTTVTRKGGVIHVNTKHVGATKGRPRKGRRR